MTAKRRRPLARNIASILEREELESFAARLEKDARDTIRLHSRLVPEKQIRIGKSKLGGLPDLPRGFSWPQGARRKGAAFPLPFVAQIALADLPKFEDRSLLPKNGCLSFFCNPRCFWEQENANWTTNWRVLHFEEPLVRTSIPETMSADARWDACALSRTRERTLPDLECAYFERFQLATRQRESYAEAQYNQNANIILHQLLGWAAYMQPYALEHSYARAHPVLFPDEPALPRSGPARTRAMLRGRLLLQVGSNESGMQFGRSGRLYFFIREDDLSAKDFSRVWTYEQ